VLTWVAVASCAHTSAAAVAHEASEMAVDERPRGEVITPKNRRASRSVRGSVGFLDTLIDPVSWRDRLKTAGDPNDEYFVARMSQDWASYNLGTEMTAWLKSPSRHW